MIKPKMPVRSIRAVSLTALAIGVAMTVPVLVQAQSSMPAGSPGRFTMHPADGGVLRLDTQTGALSMCKQVSGSWTCSILPDDRAALTAELSIKTVHRTAFRAFEQQHEYIATSIVPTK